MRVPLACGLAAVAVWYAFVAPALADLHAATMRASAAESEIHRVEAEDAARPAERGVGDGGSAVDAVDVAGTGPVDVNAVLGELQSAAADSNVQITAVRPRGQSDSHGLPGVAVELAFFGTFHSAGRFLGRVASMSRMTAARDVHLRTGPEHGTPGTVVGSLVVMVYELVPRDAEPAAYDDAGRREPFASRVEAPVASVPPATGIRPHGLAGVSLSDVVVRGLARRGDRALAILETASRQSFVVRRLDRLADAVVEDIDPSGVVFAQRDGGDGAVLVRKSLRPSLTERP